MNTPPSHYQGQVQFVTTDRVSTLTAAPTIVKLKKFAALCGSGLFVGAIMLGVAYLFDVSWLVIVGYATMALAGLVGLFLGMAAKVTDCPYCAASLGGGMSDHILKTDDNEQIECDVCHQWLISHEGHVRAFRDADAAGKSAFSGFAFEPMRWANECIVCGRMVSHYGVARATKLHAEQLLVGTLSVSSGEIANIPYCDQHNDVVTLTITDDKPRLVFPDLAMLRRYLAANPPLSVRPLR